MKYKLRIISHYLGHWALKTLILVSACLGGIFITAVLRDTMANIAFFACIIFAYALLTALIEHDEEWFFLRKRN